MTRPSPRQVRAAMDALAGDALTLEAERIAALPTRLARVLAIAELYERKDGSAGWIHGHAKTLWAKAIADLTEREARLQAMQEIPVHDEDWVRNEVRRLWTVRREAQAKDGGA
jgi:hypothetical protein